jgi:protein SCO1/2
MSRLVRFVVHGGLPALVCGALLLAWFPRSVAAVPPTDGVRFEQRIGVSLPMNAVLRDDTGRRRTLGEFFGAKPVVLFFGYARCPQLCSVVSGGVVESLRHLVPAVGRDFEVLSVSIDPTDSTNDLARLKAQEVGRYGRTGAEGGWHCLGADEHAIHEIADAAGFHVTYDPRSRLYAHASGIVVLTPAGQVSQYFLGLDFNPTDVASALRRAGEGQVGHSVFNLVLRCARGSGIAGRYGRMVWYGLEIGVAATVLGLALGIGRLLRAERARAAAESVEVAP